MRNELPENELSGEDHILEIEERLRAFRPVAPRLLRVKTRPRLRLALVFSLAAGLCVVAIAVHLQTKSRHETSVAENPVASTPPSNQPLTLGELNAALRSSDQDFLQLLDKASPNILAHAHSGTALYELSKE